MWSNYSQPHQTHLYPLPPPHIYSHPHQIRAHLLPPPPYHHPPHHPNTFSAPTYWPYQHSSHPAQLSHLPSTNMRNKPMSSNPPPFQPTTGFTKSTDHRVAKQKQEHNIRMKHLIRMLSLGPPPPPLAAPADQPVRRSRGGRRTPASICGRGRGSILNNRLGRVYGQHNTSDTKYEDEFKSRNGEQTETRTEEEENNFKEKFSGVQMIEHGHSTQILPPENHTPSSGPSFTPLNIDLPPSNPRCRRLPPPPSSCIPLPSSDLPSQSSFPLPPPSSNPPPPNSCFPPPKKNQPPPVRNSFPPPSDCHQLAGSSITPPGSGLPPPASSIPASTILPPPENSSLYTRRPTQTVETCDWKPTRTVDYEGVWSPGVVTEYREKVVGAGEEVFQPEMFDYGHGGEEGGEVEGEETVKQCEGEKEEGVSNIERKEYSRKRLVGFF